MSQNTNFIMLLRFLQPAISCIPRVDGGGQDPAGASPSRSDGDPLRLPQNRRRTPEWRLLFNNRK